jgi:starch phosphorylase
MEYGLHETLPIYSGGLGVLAGDHLKEASDLGLHLVAVGLMYAQGCFSQRISGDGWQGSRQQSDEPRICLSCQCMDRMGTASPFRSKCPTG